MLSICAACEEGVQYFLRGTVGDTINPKDVWHGGANYPRISCTGVPKRGDVRITVTPGRYLNETSNSRSKYSDVLRMRIGFNL